MKIVCISDTHLQHNFIVPDGDILIHAGDLTWRGEPDEIRKALDWFSSCPHKYKVLIAGNHDWLFQKNPRLAKLILNEYRGHFYYLQDDYCHIQHLKIYGSPWQPEFCDWAFNLPRGEALAKKWEMIPNDIDILVTHGPPYEYLDQLPLGERVGCIDLKHAVERIQPKLHIFGHIHCAYGIMKSSKIRTTFVNAAICNEGYSPVNKPIVVEI